MQQLNKYDLQWCVRRLPWGLRAAMKKNEIIVAGGYIRSCATNEKINDIDIFMPSPSLAEETAIFLAEENKTRLIKTDNAITVKGFNPVLQFVTRWTYSDPLEVICSFDFSVCQSAFWWDHYCEKWQSVCSDSFYQDLASKRLIYTAPERHEDAGGSLLRVLKYYQRGYRITLDSYAGTIARMVKEIDFDRATDEIGIKKVLKGLLVEVDPSLDPDHILDE